MTILKVLSFERCENLEDMPTGLNHLSSLQKISFENYKKMKIEGDSFYAFTSLTYLNLSFCIKIEIIDYGFTNLVSLERLSFKDCTNLKKIHFTSDDKTNLKVFLFEGCEDSEDMLMELKHLTSLQVISLSVMLSLVMH